VVDWLWRVRAAKILA